MQPITKISFLGIRLATIAAAVYWVAMFIGTHVPDFGDYKPGFNDKTLHFTAFFGLTLLLCYVTNSDRWFRRFCTIGLIVMTYAAVDELTQGLVPGRKPDLRDFLADSAGIWTAITFYLIAKTAWAKLFTVPQNA